MKNPVNVRFNVPWDIKTDIEGRLMSQIWPVNWKMPLAAAGEKKRFWASSTN